MRRQDGSSGQDRKIAPAHVASVQRRRGALPSSLRVVPLRSEAGTQLRIQEAAVEIRPGFVGAGGVPTVDPQGAGATALPGYRGFLEKAQKSATAAVLANLRLQAPYSQQQVAHPLCGLADKLSPIASYEHHLTKQPSSMSCGSHRA